MNVWTEGQRIHRQVILHNISSESGNPPGFFFETMCPTEDFYLGTLLNVTHHTFALLVLHQDSLICYTDIFICHDLITVCGLEDETLM